MTQVSNGHKVTRAALLEAIAREDYMVLAFVSESRVALLIDQGVISEDMYTYQQDALEEMNYMLQGEI